MKENKVIVMLAVLIGGRGESNLKTCDSKRSNFEKKN
jgi:hypothetical protein